MVTSGDRTKENNGLARYNVPTKKIGYANIRWENEKVAQ